MPCYTEVTEEERAAGYRKEFRHNSDVAEMLCALMGATEGSPAWFNAVHPKLIAWYEEHKERDRKKAEKERKDADYKRRIKEWRAKEPKR